MCRHCSRFAPAHPSSHALCCGPAGNAPAAVDDAFADHGPPPSLPADQDTDDRVASRLQLLARVSAGYDMMEVVQVEVRLKNVSKGRIVVDSRLDLAAGNVSVFVTQPSGAVVQVQPVVRCSSSPKLAKLDPDAWQTGAGADRFSALIGLSYGGTGALHVPSPVWVLFCAV